MKFYVSNAQEVKNRKGVYTHTGVIVKNRGDQARIAYGKRMINGLLNDGNSQ